MLWIKLTSAIDGTPIWVNMGLAHCIEMREGDCTILTGESRIPVRETPDVVLTKIATATAPTTPPRAE